jgi:hypothetical protein
MPFGFSRSQCWPSASGSGVPISAFEIEHLSAHRLRALVGMQRRAVALQQMATFKRRGFTSSAAKLCGVPTSFRIDSSCFLLME